MFVVLGVIEIAAIAILVLLSVFAVVLGLALLRRAVSLIKTVLTCLTTLIFFALVVGLAVAAYQEGLLPI